MKGLAISLACTVAITLTSTSIGKAEEATILKQAGAPLEITNYTNRYAPPDRVGDGTVKHSVTVSNLADQDVLAYGIGFYLFDSFKRDMGRPFLGYAMDPVALESIDRPRWEQRPSAAFLFEGHGHGLAYVAIARMADGTVWRADENEITRQLDEFEFQLSESAEQN